MIEKLKDKVLKDLSDINSVGLITDKEKKIYESLLKTANKETILLIESQILETAQNNVEAGHDIKILYMIITQMERVEDNLKDFINVILEEDPFKIFSLKGFDLYKIFKRKTGSNQSRATIRINTIYHAIIKVEFNGKEYSFGYNPAQRTLSFSVDNGPIKYFQLVSYDMGETEDDLKEAIANIMDVSWRTAD